MSTLSAPWSKYLLERNVLSSLYDVGMKTLFSLTDDLSLMQMPMWSLVMFLHIDNLMRATIGVQ